MRANIPSQGVSAFSYQGKTSLELRKLMPKIPHFLIRGKPLWSGRKLMSKIPTFSYQGKTCLERAKTNAEECRLIAAMEPI
jgi:hypothetical protein